MADERSAETTMVRRLPRRPQQQRSRDRVERLIDAADEVLATEGYGALTVRRIAAAAGVPVGSIYQFFPDKHAIVDVLSRRYLETFASAMDQLQSRSQAGPWDDPVGVVVDAFVELCRDNPGYRAIWLDHHLSPEMVRADEENDDRLAARLRQILLAQTAVRDSEELAQGCRVAIYLGGALLRRAFRLDPNGDSVLIDEIKRIERLYVHDLVR